MAIDSRKEVIPPLHVLLQDITMERLLQFLHKMHLRFTLSTTDKGLYNCRLYKQIYECGEITTVEEIKESGKSPQVALINAIAGFLAEADDDFHAYQRVGWAGNGSRAEAQKKTRR